MLLTVQDPDAAGNAVFLTAAAVHIYRPYISNVCKVKHLPLQA